MAKKNLMELVFILDRSGSMSGLESDTVGGFNSTLKKQQESDGDTIVTTVLFDDKYELLHDRVDIRSIEPITTKEYYVRGSTALLDAVGNTINKIKQAQKSIKDDFRAKKVLFVITTDGLENSSREFHLPQIKGMIKTQQKAGWKFLFLGANIDAIETARDLGIHEDMAVKFCLDEEGIEASYDSISTAACMLREDEKISRSWKEKAELDYEKRSKK